MNLLVVVTSQASCIIFCRITKDTWGVALSWSSTIPLLFANFACFNWISAFISSHCNEYILESGEWLIGRISWYRSPFQFHQMHSTSSSDENLYLRWIKLAHVVYLSIFIAEFCCKRYITHHTSQFTSNWVHFYCSYTAIHRWNAIQNIIFNQIMWYPNILAISVMLMDGRCR